jgi:predicted exporter
MVKKENQTNFLQKIGKIEFVLFAFSFAGIILNTLEIKGGKLVLGLGFNAFALLYVFVAIAFRKIKTKNQFDRVVSTFSYLFLSVLIIGIMFTILKVSGVDILMHFGMVAVLGMMLLIQIRKFRVGVMSSDTTSLLYRLMLFWVVGLVAFYLLPK